MSITCVSNRQFILFMTPRIRYANYSFRELLGGNDNLKLMKKSISVEDFKRSHEATLFHYSNRRFIKLLVERKQCKSFLKISSSNKFKNF